MARDLNQVSIIGRLVKDPEIRYTTTGQPVTKFSIANNMTFMQGNERKDYANYFDINVWGNQAVSCEKYLKKGSQVAVIGSLRQNRWVDKTSGQNKSKVEITASSVQFLTPSSGGSTVQSQGSAPANIPNDGQFSDAPPESFGMIDDPWNDAGNAQTNANDPYNKSMNDDDIPF